MATPLIKSVQKYFWGDDLVKLNWKTHQAYIAQTLLEKGDTPAITWLFQQMDKKKLLQLLPTLRLSSKSKNFWSLYLS